MVFIYLFMQVHSISTINSVIRMDAIYLIWLTSEINKTSYALKYEIYEKALTCIE